MSHDDTVAGLARLAESAGGLGPDEARAQVLARRWRAAILRETPGVLPQAQFLCILAAVLGRFARDMAAGDAGELAGVLGGLVRRHAADEDAAGGAA